MEMTELLETALAHPYENGYVRVGAREDGRGWGRVRVHSEWSVYSGSVMGEPETGKTRMLEHLGMALIGSGDYEVLFCNGAPEGDSSPLLNEQMTDSAAGRDGAYHQLELMESYVRLRGAETQAGVEPSSKRRRRMWLIDDFSRLADDAELIRRITEVARVQRKRGAGIWVATCGVDLIANFGRSQALRALLTDRNVVAFHGSSAYLNTLLNLPRPPHTLPRTGGWAFCPTNDHGGTPMVCRTVTRAAEEIRA